MNPNRLVRCTECRTEFEERLTYDATACPECGADALPEYPDLDVTVTLNWDDLRLLANWSSEWAKQNAADPEDPARRDFERILQRLRAVRPENAEPLTLDDTLGELERKHGIKLMDPDLKPKAQMELTKKLKRKAGLVN